MAQSSFELNHHHVFFRKRVHTCRSQRLNPLLPAAVEHREALVSFFYLVPLELAAISRL